MYRVFRRLPPFVALVLVAVAIVGFLAGHRRAPAAAAERARLAYGQSVALEFPSMQAALDCYRSPAYQRAASVRQAACADCQLVIVEGL